MDNFQKLNSIAINQYGEFGFITLDQLCMEDLIDLNLANNICLENNLCEYFMDLDEDEMKEFINSYPQIIKISI